MRRVILTGVLTLLADVAVKLMTVFLLKTQCVLLDPLIRLQITNNTGIALGMFANQPVISIALPLIVVLVGCVLFKKMNPGKVACIAAGMILGGFAGNYGERILFGSVTDMIYFPWLPWFVCNLADIAVCAGAVLLGWAILRGEGS